MSLCGAGVVKVSRVIFFSLNSGVYGFVINLRFESKSRLKTHSFILKIIPQKSLKQLLLFFLKPHTTEGGGEVVSRKELKPVFNTVPLLQCVHLREPDERGLDQLHVGLERRGPRLLGHVGDIDSPGVLQSDDQEKYPRPDLESRLNHHRFTEQKSFYEVLK